MNTCQTAWMQEPSRRPPAHTVPAFLINPVLSQKSEQNPNKADHFRELRFVSACPGNTYNFNPLRWRNFSHPDLNLNHTRNLNLISAPHACRLVSIRGRYPKLTKTDRF